MFFQKKIFKQTICKADNLPFIRLTKGLSPLDVFIRNPTTVAKVQYSPSWISL